jgi:hypothetical protein
VGRVATALVNYSDRHWQPAQFLPTARVGLSCRVRDSSGLDRTIHMVEQPSFGVES